MSRSPVILEVALNGVTRSEQNAAVPRDPEEIAKDSLACFAAGAAIVHSHTDNPLLAPEEGGALYLEAYRVILDERPDAILYPTMGVGDTIERRYGHHEVLARAGAIRCGVADTGSVNLGATGPDGLPAPMDLVYANPPSNIIYMIEGCRRLGLGPSVAIFEPGFLRAPLAYYRAGKLPPGTLIKFYFAAGGFFSEGEPLFSPPPIPEALDLYLAMLGDADIPWSVAVLGGSLLDSPIAAMALERGGHIRVGLEDFQRAESNVSEVERAKALCADSGRPLATIFETTQILGLPDRS